MVQRRERSLLQRKLHRTVGQGSEEIVDLINQVVAETAAGSGIQIETHGHLILTAGQDKWSIRTMRSNGNCPQNRSVVLSLAKNLCKFLSYQLYRPHPGSRFSLAEEEETKSRRE